MDNEVMTTRTQYGYRLSQLVDPWQATLLPLGTTLEQAKLTVANLNRNRLAGVGYYVVVNRGVTEWKGVDG